MNFGGLALVSPNTRARCGTLLLAAFCMACAASYARAQAPASRDVSPRSAEVLGRWRAGLRSTDPQVRAQGDADVLALGAEAVPGLLLNAKTSMLQLRVNKLLARIGAPAIAELARLLDDPAMGAPAAMALSEIIGPRFGARIPALIDCIRRRAELRETCGRALARASGPESRGQVSAVLPLLHEKEASLRAAGLLSIALMGPPAPAATEPVVAALKDPDPLVRIGAIRAVERLNIRRADAVAAVRALVDDNDANVKVAAKAAVKKFPKASAVAAPRRSAKPK
jgi:hypothetical protein